MTPSSPARRRARIEHVRGVLLLTRRYYVVHASEQQQLLLDEVSPVPSSINAAAVAHLDAKKKRS
jgi:hypothetical protein